MKVAFFSGCVEYSVCLANSLRKDCKLDFIYNGNYARSRDVSVLDLLESQIRKIELGIGVIKGQCMTNRPINHYIYISCI